MDKHKMGSSWLATIGTAYGVLFLAGLIICFAMSFFQCQKVDIAASALEASIFALPGSLAPLLPSWVIGPFTRVLQDVFGVDPEFAPTLGLGYVMMLLSWIMAARMTGRIQNAVCVPTPDEVAEFKAYFQKKAAEKDRMEAKQSGNAPRKA